MGPPGVRPRIERAIQDRLARVGHDPLQREGEDVAEPAAIGAGAIRAVEGEELRPRLREGAAARGAGPAVEERELLSRRSGHVHAPRALAPRQLQRFPEPHPIRGRRRKPVDEDLGVTTRTVDTHVSNLRSKLGAGFAQPFIVAVHKVGYKFVEPQESRTAG